MNIKNKLLSSLFAMVICSGVALQTQALPISVSDSQQQTVDGQQFDFSFSSLPTFGTNGLFELMLRGDYSGLRVESAVVTFDTATGMLDVGQSTDGVISNSISGLSLLASNQVTYGYNDELWDFDFGLSDTLLNSIIADGIFNVTVDLDPYVNNFNDLSYAAVGLSYESVLEQEVVSEPASLALLGFALLGLAFRSRKHR